MLSREELSAPQLDEATTPLLCPAEGCVDCWRDIGDANARRRPRSAYTGWGIDAKEGEGRA